MEQIAPKIHNLVRLTELTDVKFDQKTIYLLSEMNVFNIQGRYPEIFIPIPSKEEANDYILRIKEVYIWLNNQL